MKQRRARFIEFIYNAQLMSDHLIIWNNIISQWPTILFNNWLYLSIDKKKKPNQVIERTRKMPIFEITKPIFHSVIQEESKMQQICSQAFYSYIPSCSNSWIGSWTIDLSIQVCLLMLMLIFFLIDGMPNGYYKCFFYSSFITVMFVSLKGIKMSSYIYFSHLSRK